MCGTLDTATSLMMIDELEVNRIKLDLSNVMRLIDCLIAQLNDQLLNT